MMQVRIICSSWSNWASPLHLIEDISCYSPTNVSEETELIAFYDELSCLVRSILKHNVLVIGDVMNAQIGKNGNTTA